MATADFYRNQDANDTLVNSYYDADGYFPSETEWQYEHPSKSFYGWCKSRDGKGTLYHPNTTERFEDGESYYAIWLDLTGTIWEFKSSGLDLDNHPDYYSWQFESNGNTYAELSTHTWDIEGEYTLFYEGTKVYDVENGGWTNEAYRTITITSMDYPNDAKSELEFLRNNATRIIPPTPYLTTDVELTSIADAIRAKGGTSAPLVYPTGFVSAIENLLSGGGVGEVVFSGSMAITNSTNLWEYINDGGGAVSNCAYIVVLQDLYINNHSMDWYSQWVMFLPVVNFERPIRTSVTDSMDDYSYEITINMKPAYEETTMWGGTSLSATITKIIKVEL